MDDGSGFGFGYAPDYEGMGLFGGIFSTIGSVAGKVGGTVFSGVKTVAGTGARVATRVVPAFFTGGPVAAGVAAVGALIPGGRGAPVPGPIPGTLSQPATVFDPLTGRYLAQTTPYDPNQAMFPGTTQPTLLMQRGIIPRGFQIKSLLIPGAIALGAILLMRR